MYTSLCSWVFHSLTVCGLCFPSQTFVGSYSFLPVPLLGQIVLLVGPLFLTTRIRSTLFHKQIFTIYCYIREIVEMWECVWYALPTKALTALQVLFLIRTKCGSNWWAFPDQYNGESGLCSLSACRWPEVAIYKQVSNRSCKCMSLFCGFQPWACVRIEAISALRLCLSPRVLWEFLWTATYDFMKHLNSSNWISTFRGW